MSVVLKAKKLVRMSPDEWRHRIREYREAYQERRNFEAEIAKICASEFDFFTPEFAAIHSQLLKNDLTGLLASPEAMRQFPIPLNHRKGTLFQLLYPHEFIRSIDRADQFLTGRFKYMGIECHFPENIPWQADPVSQQQYPAGFYRDLQIFKNRPGQDIKHIWEINRLQFLIEIAKAAYLTGEEKYRAKLEFHLRDWFEKNPYKTGVNWTSALEVGVRAFSLIWIFNFYVAAANPSAEIVLILLKLLYLSGRFIKDNLSLYFSPYNHLIGEVAALFMIGYQFPLFKNAADWQSEAWQVLDEQIEKQFSADGGTVEQATFYHHFTLGFYLQCANTKRINGEPVAQRVMNQCERSIEFAMQMMRPDRTLPWIGDIDSARSLYFSEPANWNFTSFQGIGAVWFERGDMKAVAGKLGEEAFWLLPQSEFDKFNSVETQPPQNLFYSLGSSGYTIMRDGWQADSHFSYIDCGQIADGLFKSGTPSAAHGHADLLHFEICAFGENLLIDPGFCNYRGDLEWHRYFRSSAAHNTLTIDGLSQLDHVGILNWSNAPEFFPLQRFAGEFCVAFAGEHHGFKRLPAKAVHRRYFLFVEQKFWLTFDCMHSVLPPQNRQQHCIEAHFHTVDYAEIQLSGKSPASFLIQGESATLQANFATRETLSVECSTDRGGDSPEKGWISPTYREKKPASIVRVAADCTLPFEMIGVYLPEKIAAEKQFSCKMIKNGFSVQSSDCQYMIELISLNEQNGSIAVKQGVRISKISANLQQAIFLQSLAGPENNSGYVTAPIIKI